MSRMTLWIRLSTTVMVNGHAIDVEHMVGRAETRLHRKFADCNSGVGGEVEIVVALDQPARRLQVRIDDATRLALGRIRHDAALPESTGGPATYAARIQIRLS